MPLVAFAGIAALVLALLGLLLLLGAPLFTSLFNATVGRLPIVGGYIAGYLSDAFAWATSGLMAVAQTLATPVVHLFWAVISDIWAIPAAVVDAITGVIQATGRVATRLSHNVASLQAQISGVLSSLSNRIVATLAAAETYALALYHDALGTISQTAANLQANINALNGVLSGAISAVSAQVSAYALGLYHDALGAISQTAANLQANINSVENAALGAVAGAEAKAAADLAAAVGGVEAFAQTAAGGAAAALAAELDHAAHDLVLGPWAALLPDLEAIVAQLPQTVAQSIPGLGTITDPLPISLPGILSALGVATAVVAHETSTCTVPMCRSLGGLTGLLGNLVGDAIWVALVALVVEAVHDPQAAVDGLRTVVSPIVEATAHEVTNLVGV